MFTQKPDPLSRVTEGQDATLMCRTFGAPKPKIKWAKNGQFLGGNKYDIKDNGDLVIKNVNDRKDEVGNFLTLLLYLFLFFSMRRFCKDF